MSTRSHYDDWTSSGPPHEGPGREMSSGERPCLVQHAAAVATAPLGTPLQAGARRERRSLVLVPSMSRDVPDSPDCLKPVDGAPALANAGRREPPRGWGP